MKNIDNTFLIATFIAIVHTLDAQMKSNCTTPLDEDGFCVPKLHCPKFNWNGQIILNPDQLMLFRNSGCGIFDGMFHVCCPINEIESRTSSQKSNMIGLEILRNTLCGRTTIYKVANGQKVPLFTLPWMVLLKYNSGKPYQCGGSLISDRYVLTAAHCVERHEGIVTEVRLGENDISTEPDCNLVTCAPPVEDVGIEKIIIPQQRSISGLQNDIALIRLNRTVEFKRHIRPICLPITSQLQGRVHGDYIVAGWGRTEKDENGDSTDSLMMASVPLRENELCESSFRITGLTTDHMCVGGEDLIDSCQGDSGGPLIAFDRYTKYNRFIQFGIVSLGVTSCGKVNLPGVYTNVSSHMDWILSNMEI